MLHASMQVAEQTPLTAARYGELALEAGIPPGVLNVIQGGAPRCLWGPRCRCLISTPVVKQRGNLHPSAAIGRAKHQQLAVLMCRLWPHGGRGAGQPPRRRQGGL